MLVLFSLCQVLACSVRPTRRHAECCAKRAIETVLSEVKKWNGTVRFHLTRESENLAYELAKCLQYSCTVEDATPLQLDKQSTRTAA